MKIITAILAIFLVGSAGAYEDIPESYSFPDVSPYVRGLGGEHRFYDDMTVFSEQSVVTSISFSKVQYHIRVGEDLSLHVTSAPFDADLSMLEWNVLEGGEHIDLVGTGRHGSVRALSEGSATVHVESGGLFAEAVIIVDKCTPDEIFISMPSNTISVGESLSLALRCTPDDADPGEIVWSIAHGTEKINLRAQDNGALLTAVSSGKARICADACGMHAEVEVSILVGDAPTKSDGILNSLPTTMKNTGVGLLALSWTGYSVKNHRKKHKTRRLP